tara:strand:+ start:330 stop:584 length:255 start_codon:yes stop_codon:yes gene_type:complete
MKLTKKEEKRILCKFIETLVRFGYDISPYIQKPCSYFNMKAVLNHIVEIHKDHGEFNESREFMPEMKEEFISELEEEFGQFTNQ